MSRQFNGEQFHGSDSRRNQENQIKLPFLCVCMYLKEIDSLKVLVFFKKGQ